MIFEVVLATSLVAVYFFYVVFRWVLHRREVYQTFNKCGIPGPKPNFLDGNMVEMRSNIPHTAISRWFETYGEVFGMYYGEAPFLVTKDLELVKQVLVKDFANFTDRPEMYLETKPLNETVLALTGQRWKAIRSILTPTFSSGKIKLMTKLINKRIDTTVKNIETLSRNGQMFDIYDNLQGLTLDVIADCALAMNVDCQNNLKDPFLLAVRNFIRLSHNKAMEYAIKFSFLAPLFLYLGRFTSASQGTAMVVKNVKEQIRYRRMNPGSRKVDLLQIMLESADGEPNEDPTNMKIRQRTQMTDDELVANAYVFILAGYETTSTALAFTFWLLTQHEDVQQRMYEEIMKVCEGGEVTYENVQSMKYMDQVFSESMRLYPPVTGFVSRRCLQECEVGQYTIPKDTHVMIPVWHVHRDPENWSDPTTFDPERFSPENKSSIKSMSYLPFGYGPRNCIGMRFAQLEAKLALARLLHKFKFVTCEKTENPLTLTCPTVITYPENGIYLRAIIRNAKV